MEYKHTWNSDNKCIQIHSPNNIFIFNKKKQWILSVVTRHFFFFFFCRKLQTWINYIWPLQRNFPTIHKVKIDSGSGINQWKFKTKAKGC